MAIPSGLLRTPWQDTYGNISRPWIDFLNGLSSSGAAGGYISISPAGADVSGDIPNGNNPCVQLTLNGTTYAIHAPTVAGAAPNAGDRFTLYVDQDAVGNRPFPVFDTGSGAFSADFNNQAPMLTASTRTILVCTFHGDVWGLDSFRTNASIS